MCNNWHTISYTLGLFILWLAPASLRGDEWEITPESNLKELTKQIRAGDSIVLADGEWRDVDLKFELLQGTAQLPITIRAQTPGGVVLTGRSTLRISGQYLVVSGLQFRNIDQISDVVQLRTHSQRHAHHCRITQCSFEQTADFETKFESRWLSLYGTHNRIDHCAFEGKKSRGTTVVVWVTEQTGNHRLDHNYFGPRPELGRNGGETLRIGTSSVSELESRTTVEDNYFFACDGESEIISNKSCGNLYRHNVFEQCAGALTLRHGHRCVVDGNLFLGRQKSGTGGVRVIGSEHQISNNYFEGLRGDAERAALCFMNGIPNSPLEQYAPVSQAVISNNTFIDCKVSVEFGVGAGSKQSVAAADCKMIQNAFIPGKWAAERVHARPERFEWIDNLVELGRRPDVEVLEFKAAPLQFAQGDDQLWRPTDTSVISVSSPAANALDFDGQPRAAGRAGCDEPGTVLYDWPTPESTSPSWLSGTDIVPSSKRQSSPSQSSIVERRSHEGSLVLAGGGALTDDILGRFLELAGDQPRLVVIPTASNRELDEQATVELWQSRGFQEVAVLHTRDREKANQEAFVAPLESATAVWFGGGSQQRISDAYIDTLVERRIYEVLERGGVVGGTSAGAAIQSRVMIAGGTKEPTLSTGLDLLMGGIVDQHFLARDRIGRLLLAIEQNPDRIGFGIDESTALVVHQGKATVVGRSFVLRISAENGRVQVNAYSAGESIPLPALSK